MQFSGLDLVIVLIYLLFILLIGIFSKSREKSVDSYFLGNKSIPWFYIMLSIVATETSSLTFLGVPGISYKSNFNFLQIALGFIIGRIFVSYYILPLYIKGNYTSVYNWVGDMFGKNTQKSMSSVFLITRILSDGVRLYAVSIPIALIFHSYFSGFLNDTETGIIAIALISITTIIYSSFGGFKSVVTTDALQFLIYIVGGFFALYFIFSSLGFERIFSFPHLIPKTEFFNFNTENAILGSPYFFVNSLLGGIFISIGSHGVDQLIAQRTLACKTPSEARKALIFSGIVVFIQFTLFLLIGLLLAIHYDGQTIPSDAVFAKFILEEIPSPFSGIIIAAILASAMSTFSSSINALSLSVIVDWSKKIIANDSGTSEQDFNRSRLVSIVWGVILMFSSFIPFFLSENVRGGVVVLGLKISSLTFGPMIGIFILARLEKNKPSGKTKPLNLIYSLVISIILTSILAFKIEPAFTLLIPMGITIFLLLFFLLSSLSAK